MCRTLRAAPRSSCPRLAQLPPPSCHPAWPDPASVADPCWRGSRSWVKSLWAGVWACTPWGLGSVPVGGRWQRLGQQGLYSSSCLLGSTDSSRVLVGLSIPFPSCTVSADWTAGQLVPQTSCSLRTCLQSPLLSSVPGLVSLAPSSSRNHLYCPSAFSPALTPSA